VIKAQPLASFKERQEKILTNFKLSLISNTVAIVHLKNSFSSTPPDSNQILDIIYKDEFTGENINLGSIPADSSAIDDLTKHKRDIIRHSISQLVDNFEFFLEDLYDDFCVQLWDKHKNMDLFVSYVRLNRRDLDSYLKAFKIVGCPDVVSSIKESTKIPLELRHLWTHRGALLDEEFFKRIGRNEKTWCTVTFLGIAREIEIGNEFPIRQADVQDLASPLSHACESLVRHMNNV
jgi:hypothetical protein